MSIQSPSFIDQSICSQTKPGSTIAFLGQSLHIEHLVITDPEIIRFLTANLSGEDPEIFQTACEERLLRGLRIGAVALQRAEIQVDLDAIKHEFDNFHNQVEGSFKGVQGEVKKALEDSFDGDRGRVKLVLDRYLGEGGTLFDLFNEDKKSSAIGKIKTIFEQHFEGDGSKFVRMLDCTVDGSPLKKFYDGMDKRLKELDDRMVDLQGKFEAKGARESEHEKGTQKGGDFEILLAEALDEVARYYKDTVTLVGGQTEIGASKVGDILIDLNPDDFGGQKFSIVIEAKCEAGKPLKGKHGILAELINAKENRNASFGIAVFSEDACPKEVRYLRDYSENRLICAVPADVSQTLVLEAAYRIARTELCYQKRHTSQTVDQGRVSEMVKMVEEKLGQFQGLKSKATQLSGLANEIRSQLDAIESDIRASLKVVLGELGNGEKDLK